MLISKLLSRQALFSVSKQSSTLKAPKAPKF
jgi:hypothetical protein